MLKAYDIVYLTPGQEGRNFITFFARSKEQALRAFYMKYRMAVNKNGEVIETKGGRTVLRVRDGVPLTEWVNSGT